MKNLHAEFDWMYCTSLRRRLGRSQNGGLSDLLWVYTYDTIRANFGDALCETLHINLKRRAETMIVTAFCPFCQGGAAWSVEDQEPTFADDGYHITQLVSRCKHADKLSDLFDAMEAYAFDEDKNRLHAWEAEALANATQLGIPIDDPVNVAATEAGMGR